MAAERGLLSDLPQFLNSPDELRWNWSNTGVYSAASFYTTRMGGGLIKWEFLFIWKLKVPPTVRVFLFLLLMGKLLTKEVLLTRNMLHGDATCIMCNEGVLETDQHLFLHCTHAIQIWDRICRYLGHRIRWEELSIQEALSKPSADFNQSTGARNRW